MFGRDSKRLNGPSDSLPISSFIKGQDSKESWNNLLDEKGQRIDGRKWDEIRPIFLRTGIVEQAKGSSYYETSGAKVICSVYGPREAKRKTEFSAKGKVVCDVTFAPFSQASRQPSVQEAKTKNLSDLVETALGCAVCFDSFPKSQLDVYIKVIQDSGDVVSASIVGASAALADAGIKMYDLVSACSLAFDDQGFVMDPSDTELKPEASSGSLTIGYLPSLNLISCIVQNGTIHMERNVLAIKACMEGCLRMHAIMQDCIVSGIERKKQMLDHEHKYT